MALDAGSVVAKFKADISEMKSGISQVKTQVSGMKSSFANAGKEMASAGRMIATGLVVAGVAVGALGLKGVKTAGQLETAQKAFEGLFGSAEEAEKTINRIKKESASTPFELVGLTEATKQLSSVTKTGDEAIDILLSVGKAVTASGGSQEELDRVVFNLKQIKGMGELSAIDLKELRRAIPIFDKLVEATGTTVEQIQNSADPAKALFDVFTEGAKKMPAVGNAFEIQAGTFNQLMSNMKDSFTIAMSDIAVKSGLFDAVKNGVKAITDFLMTHKDDIVAWINNAVSAIQNFYNKAVEFFAPLIKVIKDFFSEVENRKAVFIGVLVAMGLMLAAAVIAFIAAHATVIAIVAAVMVVVGFFYRYWQQIWGGILIVVDAVKTYFQNLIAFWVGVFNTIGAAFMAFYTTIIKPVIDAIVAYFQFWASIFSWVWNNVVFPLLYLAYAIFARIFFEIYNAVVKPVVDLIGAALSWLGGWISNIWNAITSATSRAWNAVKNYMSAPINEAKGTITGIVNSISDFLRNAWNSIKEFFVSAKQSFVDALVAPFEAAKKKIEEIAKKIKDAADKINPFHRNSPSLVDWVQKGMGVIKDEYAGLYSTLNNLDFKGAVIGIADQMNFTPTFQPAGAKVIQQNVYADIKDGMDVETLSDRLAFKYRNA